MHRGASRFRDTTLLPIKMGVYSFIPPSQLADVAKQELVNLKEYLTHNLNNNPYYAQDSELKNLLIKLINQPESPDQPMLALAKALTGLRRLINHPDYNDKVSGLKQITNSLSYLYSLTKNVVALKDSQYQQAYKSVSKLLHKLDIKEPSVFCMFSNSFYQIPANQNMFPEVLEGVANLKEKYHLHAIMKQVKERLADKYGAYNFEFKYEYAKLQVKFKLMDDKTLATTSNELAIHVDVKNKKYIPEPIVAVAAIVQPAAQAAHFGV
jgi:hypothetical protein